MANKGDMVLKQLFKQKICQKEPISRIRDERKRNMDL
jgi:hypothetical protein